MLPALSREVGSGFGALHGINALRDHGRRDRGRQRAPRQSADAAAPADARRHGLTGAAARPTREPARPDVGVREGPRQRTWIAVAATPCARCCRWAGCGSRACCPTPTTWRQMGYADWGGGPVGRAPRHGSRHAGRGPGRRSDRPADVRETLTVHVEDGRYTVNGTSPGPGAGGDRRRPGRGDPGQRQRRRRHHAALARGRRPERRGRRRRRDPGRGRSRARSTSTASWPSTRAPSGTTRTRSPTSRCAAASSAPS